MPSSISKSIQAKLLKKSRKKGAPSPGKKKKQKTTPICIPPVSTAPQTILINRSPILTLWVAVVAERLFSLKFEEAMTVGSAYAAECARAKGTSLGIYTETTQEKKDGPSEDAGDAKRQFLLMNQTIRANQTPAGWRAIGNKEEEIDPHQIWKSLTKKLGDDLPFVLERMREAAEAAGEDLDASAYNYYVHVRPGIPHGTKGWGAHGHLQTSKLSDFYPVSKPPPSVK
eukprot:Sro713_g191580.2  (228) ;mRNA; r:23653-24336